MQEILLKEPTKISFPTVFVTSWQQQSCFFFLHNFFFYWEPDLSNNVKEECDLRGSRDQEDKLGP